VVLVNAGLTIAAMIAFFVARYVVRELVELKLGYYLHRFDAAVERDGGFYLFALRVLHAPYTFLNYSFGATTIRPRTFWWASQLGMLPGNLVFVYAGAQVPSLNELAEKGIWSIVTPDLILAFVLLSIFPFVARLVIRKIRLHLSSNKSSES